MDPLVSQKIDQFFSAYAPRTFDKGHILIRAHEQPPFVFHLTSGRVKQYDISYRGDQVILNVFKPPAFFPMSTAINHTPNFYFFEAETPLELRQAPADDAVAFLKSNPDVLFDLLARVYRGSDGLLGRVAHLMASSARSRLLYELLIEARRFGVVSGPGATLEINESDIGARAGLARETVSREMSKLKDEGLISVIKNEIHINDLERLASLISREL
jgi:CRP/FNR family cyclic AMP-dependent transcriptional regulator